MLYQGRSRHQQLLTIALYRSGMYTADNFYIDRSHATCYETRFAGKWDLICAQPSRVVLLTGILPVISRCMTLTPVYQIWAVMISASLQPDSFNCLIIALTAICKFLICRGAEATFWRITSSWWLLEYYFTVGACQTIELIYHCQLQIEQCPTGKSYCGISIVVLNHVKVMML